MKLRAPAKVNLSLRVLGRRPDGFHDLDSLMAPISLADEVTVETRIGQGVKVSCDQPDIPSDDSNLAAIAARQFHARTGIRFQADIHIAKKIPAGAGLGGGSSDAAAVLVALDSVFETQLGTAGLEEIAAKVGSDVPFFIRRGCARVRGRGEIVTPASLPAPLHLALVKPPFEVSTAWAYQRLAESKGLHGADAAPECVSGVEFVNDLERPVFEKFLLLPVIKQWLREQPGCRAALMSGSGSTVFGICDSAASASAISESAHDTFGEATWTAACETACQEPCAPPRRKGTLQAPDENDSRRPFDSRQ